MQTDGVPVKYWIIGGVLFLAIAFLVFSPLEVWKRSGDSSPLPQEFFPLQIGTSTFMVEFADTKEERDKGLSGREHLDPEHGMLFLFEEPNFYTFWMPDMHFSIDIIWISSDRHIIDITPSVPPDSYPQLFSPKVPALYVLEVSAGTAGALGWRMGERVQF